MGIRRLVALALADLAVARKGGTLEFLNAGGALTGNMTEDFGELYAMTYDPAADRIYLSDDSTHHNASIVHVDVQTQKMLPIVPKLTEGTVRGVAYDPGNHTLYWTTGHGRTIGNMSADGSGAPAVFKEFSGEDIPFGIAVDHCQRYLYWTNAKYRDASIGRTRLDGSDNTEIIVSDKLYQPLGIAVDQWSNKLYWVDDSEGQYYRIERSDLNGKGREVLVTGSHHSPLALAVGPDVLYWSDPAFNGVFSLPKHGGKPSLVREYPSDQPLGLIARVSSQCFSEIPTTESAVKIIDSDHEHYVKDEATTPISSHCAEKLAFCLNDGVFDESTQSCTCTSGHSGVRCELAESYNYCIHGSFYRDSRGLAQCQCQLGYKGLRCHLDVCEGFCLNGGRCRVELEGEPVCECDRFEGQRCQLESSNSRHECLYGEVYRIALFALAAFCLVLMVIVALLARKVFVLSKRPRIRKQIIVKKNVTPLTSRPQAEQCEITIENCCNMNICETPCFEPQLRTSKSKSKSEEKKTLLDGMEEAAQDDLY